MSAWTRQPIWLTTILPDQPRVSVPAHCLDELGIHRVGLGQGRAWAVSHLPTGRALPGAFSTLADAKRVVQAAGSPDLTDLPTYAQRWVAARAHARYPVYRRPDVAPGTALCVVRLPGRSLTD